MSAPLSIAPGRASQPDGARRIIGTLGGVYEVLRELGPGGMANAYVVKRRGIGDSEFVYCLKRMRVDAKKAEFLEEAKVASRLRHDCIVRAVDADQDQEGFCFIAMELVDGVDLGQLLDFYAVRNQRMPVELAVFVADEMATALDYAHTFVDEEAGVHDLVHRDVTPSNILLTRQGWVKLTDFGIARWRGKPSYTRTGAIKGKLPYMSPEHFRPKDTKMDGRADIFSLGVTLFEMLSGELPFDDSEGEAALIDSILRGQAKPLLEVVPTLDPRLSELVMSMIRPGRDERPANALAVRQALRPFRLDPFLHERLAPDVESCWFAVQSPPKGAYDHNVELALQLLEARESRLLSGGANADLDRDAADPQPAPTVPAPAPEPTPHGAAPTGSSTRPAARQRRLWPALLGVGTTALTATVLWSSLSAPAAPTSPARSAVPSAVSQPTPAAPQPNQNQDQGRGPAMARSESQTPSPQAPVAADGRPEREPGDEAEARRTRPAKPKTGRVKLVVIAFSGWAELVTAGPRERLIKRGRSPLVVDELAPGPYVFRGARDESMADAVQRSITVQAGEKLVEYRLEAAKPFETTFPN